MLNRRTFTTLMASTFALGLAGPTFAQELTKVTFVQPSPSAINGSGAVLQVLA